jgi:hypothetical protein
VAYQIKTIPLDNGGVPIDRTTGERFQISAGGGLFVEAIPSTAVVLVGFDETSERVQLRALRTIDHAAFSYFTLYHPPLYKGAITLQTYEKGEGIYDVPPPSGAAPGSTRRRHIYLDWTDTGVGLGFGTPAWLQDVGYSGGSPSAWNSLSGANSINGFPTYYLGATSSNQGEASRMTIPIVGRPSPAFDTTITPEWAQLFSYRFLVGLDDNGATGWPDDVCILFTTQDGRSFSSYPAFYGDGTNGAAKGVALFMKNDFTWHYGIRYVEGVSPLDIDINLTALGLMPGGSAAAAKSKLMPAEFRWIDPGGQTQPQFQFLIAGATIVDTTLADRGSLPTGAGFASQVPSMFGTNANEFGWLGIMRSTVQSPAPRLSFRNIEYTEGLNLSTTP